jgi:hypothetical protein
MTPGVGYGVDDALQGHTVGLINELEITLDYLSISYIHQYVSFNILLTVRGV